MAHAPEDVMCAACRGDRPLWTNTKLTEKDIRRFFRKEPCLICVLAKKRKEGMHQWMVSHQQKKLRFSQPTEEAIKQEEEERKKYKPGQCISCDNISINPVAMAGETSAFIFTDTSTSRIFTFPCRTVDTATYLASLERVRLYYKHKGHKVEIVRTDYFKTFLSKKAERYYAKRDIEYQSSTPYKHWQNAVERTIQTIINYMAAIIHGTEFLRADSWAYALVHFTRVHNDLPNPITGLSPNSIINSSHQVNALQKYRFAFGDIVCHSLDKSERKIKFDIRNDVGLYLGDERGLKGGCLIYRPYKHTVTVRGDVHRLNISSVQMLEWYGRRYEARQKGLPFKTFKEAMVDLLKDAVAVDQDEEMDPRNHEQLEQLATTEGADTIAMPLFTQPVDPEARMDLRKRRERNYGPRYETEDRRTVKNRRLEAVERIIKPDDEEEALSQIIGQFHFISLHNDERTEGPVDDDSVPTVATAREDQDDEAIETREALTTAPDKALFIEAVRQEVLVNLLEKSKALEPIDEQEEARIRENAARTGRNVWKIGTVVKCKRKKRSDGTIEKRKARTAMRGDVLRRAMVKAKAPIPPSFSPTIRALTFAFLLQLAVWKELVLFTTDLAFAYLNATYDEDSDPIVTYLEPFVSDICGLPKGQRYRVRKYI